MIDTKAAVPRFDTIDILRGVSILAVIQLHVFIHLYGLKFPLPWYDSGSHLFHFLYLNGGNGVTLFFTISGFLITLTSLRRFNGLGHMRPAAFYRIRFARIAPLLLALLAVLSVLHLCKVDGFHINLKHFTLPEALFAALTFHINWLEASRGFYLPPNWDVLWSLSVEEVFYLFFPLLTFALCRFKVGRWLFIAILLAFVVMGPFARAVWTINNPMWNDSSYLGGMDGIALGCLTALLVQRLQSTNRTPTAKLLIATQLLGAAIILAIAVGLRNPVTRFLGHHGLYETLLCLGSCAILAASTLRNKIGSRFTAPIRWIGRRSYEIYMTHMFIVIGLLAFYTHNHPPQTIATLAAISLASIVGACILGGLVARFFSEPMNRLLRGAAPPPVQ